MNFIVSIKHLPPYVCPLKRGTQEVPADAPKTAKQQCTFDFSLHNNSCCDITNQSKVLISFGKQELSI